MFSRDQSNDHQSNDHQLNEHPLNGDQSCAPRSCGGQATDAPACGKSAEQRCKGCRQMVDRLRSADLSSQAGA